jgi:hypothetical protein
LLPFIFPSQLNGKYYFALKESSQAHKEFKNYISYEISKRSKFIKDGFILPQEEHWKAFQSHVLGKGSPSFSQPKNCSYIFIRIDENIYFTSSDDEFISCPFRLFDGASYYFILGNDGSLWKDLKSQYKAKRFEDSLVASGDLIQIKDISVILVSETILERAYPDYETKCTGDPSNYFETSVGMKNYFIIREDSMTYVELIRDLKEFY